MRAFNSSGLRFSSVRRCRFGLVGHWSDRPEQTIGLSVRTGCEIERVRARFCAAAQGQRPQAVDHEPLAVRALDGIEEFPVEANALISPLPKLPMRMSPLNRPKAKDA